MRFRFALSLILLSTVASLMQACSRPLDPEESCNFVQSPEKQRVSWNKRLPVNLYIHESVPPEAYPAIESAMLEFKNKLGQDLFKIVGRGVNGELQPRRDGYSTIYWFTNWDQERKTEQARTTIYWSGVEIFEADIRINADNFRYNMSAADTFTGVDLISLFVHEFGHALGLGHIVSTGSVMNLTLDAGKPRRELGAVDLASLRCEY